MFSSLKIEGYRGFDQFEMSGLGRINLLVGTNNSGKTSVLEAVHLLASGGDPLALLQTMGRRGERFILRLSSLASLEIPPPSEDEWDVSGLFHGYAPQPGSTLRVSCQRDGEVRYIEYAIVEKDRDGASANSRNDTGRGHFFRPEMEIRGFPPPVIDRIPLTRARGIAPRDLDEVLPLQAETVPTVFVPAESLPSTRLLRMWNEAVLTESEELALKALRFVEPGIERIAATYAKSGNADRSRGGFAVRLKGIKRPVPIGTLGDGIWRMLGMSIAISQCRGGVLLVDEIDTGLHYGVMSKMWTLIYDAARDLDVQVFATTHSYDCVYSLAAICTDQDRGAVTIQRIEKGKTRSVPYDEDEITAAADHDIEVR